MKTLIKLEFERSKMQTYVISSLIIAITMLCLLYLFAYAPKLEPDDRDMAIFSSYDNIVPLFGVLNMAVYCVLAAVMYTKSSQPCSSLLSCAMSSPTWLHAGW